ncbi:MAG: hypothetical protein HQK58_15475 [Deltaproteobacteria bacterium]|nr:hypothetical protein [Deltaproteobacteria bacterium]
MLTTVGTWFLLGLMLWYIIADVPGHSVGQKIEFLIHNLRFEPWRIVQISFVYGIALAIPYVNGGGIATALMSLTGLVGIVATYVSTCLFLSLGYLLGKHSPILMGLFQRQVGKILRKHHLSDGEQIPPLFQLMELYFQRNKLGQKIQAVVHRLPFRFTLNEQNIILLLLILPINVFLGGGGGIAILCGEQSQLPYRTFLKVVCYHLIPFALFSYTVHLYVYSDAKIAAALFILGGLTLLLLYMYFPDIHRLSNSGRIVGLKRAAALAGGLGLAIASFVMAVDSVQTLPPMTYMLATGSWVLASIMAFWINRPGSATSTIITVNRPGYALAECALPGFIVSFLAGVLGGYPYRAFLDCLGLFLPLMIVFGSSGIFSEAYVGFWNGKETDTELSEQEITDLKFRAWRTFIGLFAFCVLLFHISHKTFDGQVFAVSVLVVAFLQMIGRWKGQPKGSFSTPITGITMIWANFAVGLLLAVFFWQVDSVTTPALSLNVKSLANPWIISGTALAMSATFIFSARLRPPARPGIALPAWDGLEVTDNIHEE